MESWGCKWAENQTSQNSYCSGIWGAPRRCLEVYDDLYA